MTRDERKTLERHVRRICEQLTEAIDEHGGEEDGEELAAVCSQCLEMLLGELGEEEP
jgi:hypothetical protein